MSESLVERARELLEKTSRPKYETFITFPELKQFFEDVLPVLERVEAERQIDGNGELQGEREELEAQERRTLAIAQMAATIWCSQWRSIHLGKQELTMPDAVELAREILKACEHE